MKKLMMIMLLFIGCNQLEKQAITQPSEHPAIIQYTARFMISNPPFIAWTPIIPCTLSINHFDVCPMPMGETVHGSVNYGDTLIARWNISVDNVGDSSSIDTLIAVKDTNWNIQPFIRMATNRGVN